MDWLDDSCEHSEDILTKGWETSLWQANNYMSYGPLHHQPPCGNME